MPDIQPRNKHWTEEAIARFQMCVAGIKLQARVVEITGQGVGIELTDLSTSYPRIISDVLIDEHLVLKTSSPRKDLTSNRPVSRRDLQVDVLGLQGNMFKPLICYLNLLSFAFMGCKNFSSQMMQFSVGIHASWK